MRPIEIRGEKERIPLTVEIAITPEEHRVGLMGRSELPLDQGMLFIFDTPYLYPFWMKDTELPLGMIFFDQYHRVVDIAIAEPNRLEFITPKRPSLLVLEVHSDFLKKHSVKVGDRLFFHIPSYPL